MPNHSLSNDSWDLHRRAERDRKRHNDKVKEVIKKNLGDIISQQDIITSENGKIVQDSHAGTGAAAHPFR